MLRIVVEVHGKAKDKMWTQKIGPMTYSFFNPIMQNDTHIKILQRIGHVRREDIYSFIVFSKRSRLLLRDFGVFDEETGTRSIVSDEEDIRVDLFNALQSSRSDFSMKYIGDIGKRLYYNMSLYTDKEKHNQKIKRYRAGKICPKCEARLFLLDGKYGKYYRCLSCGFSRTAKASDFDLI